ncbi:MAG: hypothetical protein R3176_06380 [Woeseiaceae bacterium]|nr:hypothetical protein [Woeseiaceae bacterium]
MSPHQILAVGVRLFAIWLAVQLVLTLPFQLAWVATYLEQAYGSSSIGISRLFYGVTALLFIVLLIVLWRFPLTVAQRILPGSGEAIEDSGAPDLWLALGCALIGLWLLAVRVPAVVFGLVQYGEGFVDRLPYPGIMLAQHVAEILIGLWLALGAKGFRKLFWWLRNAGHIHVDQ